MIHGLFDRLRATDAAAAARIAAIALAVGVCAFAGAAVFGVRVNPTMSEPIGLYVRTAAPSANMVEFCPPEPFAGISRSRGYRAPGNCPDGAAPLLKAIVAQSGDVVELSAAGMSVNGTPLPNTAPRAMDSDGRLLPRWPLGSYVVSAGMVWVASTYHPRSFDSRYFGPIAVASIRNRLNPLIVLR
jgi:conjugative transfer signal peptidase TraF